MRHTIRELIYDSVKASPETDAVRWIEKKEIRSKTYGQMWEDICRIADSLGTLFKTQDSDNKSIQGHHAAIIGPSSYEWITSYLALTCNGGVAVPLDLLLPDDALIELITRADCELLFCTATRDSLIKRAYQVIESKTTSLKKIVILDKGIGENKKDVSYADLLEKGKYIENEYEAPKACDLASIIFTSGTTGKAKGVMLSQQNQADNVESVYIEATPGAVMLSVLPIHHAYCLTMDWLKGFSKNATLCINDSLMHIMKNIKLFRPRIMLMVPLMIEMISKRLKASHAEEMPPEIIYENVFGGNLRYIFSGGAHLDPKYVEEFARYGFKICEGYGMSECAPVISTNGDMGDKPGTSGKLLPNVEARFKDGELQIRGSSVMMGYYKMEDETAKTFDDGWLKTGDLAYLDEDGYLVITGRIKNLIILSNGENVSPEEIEAILAGNELVDEVVVTGNETGLTAHIYTDPETIKFLNMQNEMVKMHIRAVIEDFNKKQPSYRRITKFVLRDVPFEKNTTKNIIRGKVA